MTKEEYREKIQQYSWEELAGLWEAIKAGNTPDWEPGKAFEYLILRAFQLERAYVLWPYKVTVGELTNTEINTAAEEIDGFIHTVDGLACLVESKNYSKDEVDVEPIAKLRSQLLRRPSMVIGIVFSRSGFTDTASLLARFTAPQIILLWGGDEVEIALKNQWFCKGLTAKYRVCAARGLPDYHISLGV